MRIAKSTILSFLVLFIYNTDVWSSMINYLVRLNVKVPENFKDLFFHFCSHCLIVGFTHPVFVFISSAISLHFDVASSNALVLSTSNERFCFSL